jgi:hypothetical protein
LRIILILSNIILKLFIILVIIYNNYSLIAYLRSLWNLSYKNLIWLWVILYLYLLRFIKRSLWVNLNVKRTWFVHILIILLSLIIIIINQWSLRLNFFLKLYNILSPYLLIIGLNLLWSLRKWIILYILVLLLFYIHFNLWFWRIFILNTFFI